MRLPSLLVAVILVSAGTTFAQEKSTSKKEKEKLRLHYERSNGNYGHQIDRTFDTQEQLDRFVDSLNSIQSPGGRTRIIIGDEADVLNRLEKGDYQVQTFRTPKPPKAPKAPRTYRDDEPLARGEWQKFDQEMERFGRDMERWGKDFGEKFGNEFRYRAPQLKRQLNLAPQVLTWEGGSSSSTVRSLSVYPNRPFNQTLNLRFTSPAKGDVMILVTDVKGREVAKEVVKDFEGDFVGQITLTKKAEKGTFFVTVTQGEDGTVKRVVIE